MQGRQPSERWRNKKLGRMSEWKQACKNRCQSERSNLGLLVAQKMCGASLEYLCFLLDMPALCDCLYIWEPASSSVDRAMPSDLAWPMVWVLARLHGKNVHVSAKLPVLQYLAV